MALLAGWSKAMDSFSERWVVLSYPSSVGSPSFPVSGEALPATPKPATWLPFTALTAPEEPSKLVAVTLKPRSVAVALSLVIVTTSGLALPSDTATRGMSATGAMFTVTVEVTLPPWPSSTTTVKLSLPLKSLLGV